MSFWKVLKNTKVKVFRRSDSTLLGFRFEVLAINENSPVTVWPYLFFNGRDQVCLEKLSITNRKYLCPSMFAIPCPSNRNYEYILFNLQDRFSEEDYCIFRQWMFCYCLGKPFNSEKFLPSLSRSGYRCCVMLPSLEIFSL